MKHFKILLSMTLAAIIVCAASEAFAQSNIIDSKLLKIRYREPEKGADIQRIELYVIRYDNKGKGTWVSAIQHTPSSRTYFTYEAPEDGKYGFRIVHFDSAGIATNKPNPGDPPDSTIIVDTTKPTITSLHKTDMLRIYAQEEFNVKWKADDANFGDRPIRIQWQPRGVGTRITKSGWADLVKTGEGWTADTGVYPVYFEENVSKDKDIAIRIIARDTAGHETDLYLNAVLMPPRTGSYSRTKKSLTVPKTISRGTDSVTITWRVANYTEDEIQTVRLYYRRKSLKDSDWKTAYTGTGHDAAIPFRLTSDHPDGRYLFYLGVKDQQGAAVGGPFTPDCAVTGFDFTEALIDRTAPWVKVDSIEIIDNNGNVVQPGEEMTFKGGQSLRIKYTVTDEVGLPETNSVRMEVSFGDNFSLLADYAHLAADFKGAKDATGKWHGLYVWKLPYLTGMNKIRLRVVAFDRVGNRGAAASGVFKVISFADNPAADRRAARFYRLGKYYSLRRDKVHDNLWNAKEAFEKSLEYGPRDYRTLVGLADVLRRLGMTSEAISYAEKAPAVYDSYTTRYLLASLYTHAGRLNDAGLQVERLLEMDAKKSFNDRRTRDTCRLVIDLADKYEKKGDLDGAIQYLSKIKLLRLSRMTEYWPRLASRRLDRIRKKVYAGKIPDSDDKFE